MRAKDDVGCGDNGYVGFCESCRYEPKLGSEEPCRRCLESDETLAWRPKTIFQRFRAWLVMVLCTPSEWTVKLAGMRLDLSIPPFLRRRLLPFVCALVAVFAFLMGSPPVSLAATVNVTWEHHPTVEQPDIPDGFRLYQRAHDGPAHVYGPDRAVASSKKGIHKASIADIKDGHWCFVVTAFDLAGNESGPSSEVCKEIDTTPPASPSNAEIEVEVNIRIRQP